MTTPTAASDTISVRMLPAGHGDALVVEWDGGGEHCRLVVDAGPMRSYAGLVADLRGPDEARTDVFVLTHVDGDHIEGAVSLLNDRALGFTPADVWFNGARHLSDFLAPTHGEVVGALIRGRGLPWNAAFGGAAIVARPELPLPTIPLPGGVVATVLAPGPTQLAQLADVWEAACRKAGIAFDSPEEALEFLHTRGRGIPEDSFLGADDVPDVDRLLREDAGDDSSAANASSIVLLLERGHGPEDERVLLAGDATLRALEPAVRRLLAERGVDRLPLTIFKLPHHGSTNNLSVELVRMLPARRYLISSDGGHYGHPDDPAIARVLGRGPRGLELVFNYDSARNRRWEAPQLLERHGHRVVFDPGVPARERAPRRGRRG